MSARRNVLLITGDQWRWECLSMLGHPCVRTPNLDALAADGILFRRHFSQATPCGPSRASLYTGLYQHNHGVMGNGTPLEHRHTNVALEARKAGYAPALFGYTDTAADPRGLAADDPLLRRPSGVLPGMDGVVHMGENFDPWFDHLRQKGYPVPEPGEKATDVLAPDPARQTAGQIASKGRTFAPARFKAEDSSAAFITDGALRHIREQNGQSWFVHMSYWSPHPPFIVPEPYNALIDAADVPHPVRAETPEAEAALHPWLSYFIFNQMGTNYSVGCPATDNIRISERDWLQLRATYYGMMAEVDANIGRLVEHLKATGQYDHTLIVFTSDHGEHLGDHWMMAKHSPFEQTFRVPLIIRDPDTTADGARGDIADDFTENVDIMPTILDWLGRDVPSACDGVSLGGHLRGQAPVGWRREAHSAFDFRNFLDRGPVSLTGLGPDECRMRFLRGNRYKYVEFAAWPPLFFDLEADPGETTNLADDPLHRERVAGFAERLREKCANGAENPLRNTRITSDGVRETVVVAP